MMIVHCSHHRCGTVWFDRIFRRISRYAGLSYFRGAQSKLPPDTAIFFQDHSEVTPEELPPHRGTHIRRDPRDVVVSCYFYHLWADEPWLHEPRARFEGMSYQEKLKSLPESDGLLLEIEGSGGNTIRNMLEWALRERRFLEIRYEDLIADEAGEFARIFEHYMLDGSALDAAWLAVEQCRFQRMTGGRRVGEVKEGDHLRSGNPGSWREHLEGRHLAKMEELFGDVPAVLGYEAS
jgi:hypothetical protein